MSVFKPAVACDACNGEGWLATDSWEVERCDACERFTCDQEAFDYAIYRAGVVPDLLAALEALLAVTEEPAIDELSNRQDIALAAIKKARGES